MCVVVLRCRSPELNAPLTKTPQASVAACTPVKCSSDLPPHPHSPAKQIGRSLLKRIYVPPAVRRVKDISVRFEILVR